MTSGSPGLATANQVAAALTGTTSAITLGGAVTATSPITAPGVTSAGSLAVVAGGSGNAVAFRPSPAGASLINFQRGSDGALIALVDTSNYNFTVGYQGAFVVTTSAPTSGGGRFMVMDGHAGLTVGSGAGVSFASASDIGSVDVRMQRHGANAMETNTGTAGSYGDHFLRSLIASGPSKLGSYTVATVPSASTYSGYYIDVSNASSGAGLFRSNGTNWLIPNTATVLS